MHEDATTKVRLIGRDSKAFSVKSAGASGLGSQPAAIRHCVIVLALSREFSLSLMLAPPRHSFNPVPNPLFLCKSWVRR